MPIYEYRCTKCGHHLEIIQKMGDRLRRKCAECGGKLDKLVSRAAFQLKGGGWYSEGYSKGGGGKKSEPKKDSATKNSTDSGKETKSSSGKSAAAS